MNTRGIVQLVVLNIGVELNVISPIIFAIFVLMATILTFVTSPILSLLYRENHDPRRFSVSHVATDLRDLRNNANHSVDDIDEAPKRSSLSQSRQASINLSITDASGLPADYCANPSGARYSLTQSQMSARSLANRQKSMTRF